MKVIIIEGTQAGKCINDCYQYLIKRYRKKIQGDSNICKGINRGTSDQGIKESSIDSQIEDCIRKQGLRMC